MNRGNGKFCSRKCAYNNNSKLVKIKKEQAPPNCDCAGCNKKFYLPEAIKRKRLKQSHSKLLFCSRACKDYSQRLGGVKEIQPSHYGSNYKYHKLAINHYGAVCSKCGYCKYPKILIVHHKDRNRHNNSLDNLEVLCPLCHDEEHCLAQDGRFTPTKDKIFIKNKRKFIIEKNDLSELLKSRTAVSIAKEFGISSTAVRNRARILGIPNPTKKEAN